MIGEPLLAPVACIEARYVPAAWPWAEAHREEIAAHWHERVAAQPKLFDGEVLLARDAAIEDGVLRAAFFRTSYSAFLAFKQFGFPDPAIANCFAMAALESADGAFLLGIMGAHTANAGRVYFPGGTPDMADVREDDSVDLAGSVERELLEETGLGAGDRTFGEWVSVRDGATLALLRRTHVPAPALEVRARILAALAREDEPELSDILIVRGPQEIVERMPRFVATYLRWRFSTRS